MANKKRSKLHYIILWLMAGLGVAIICAIVLFTSHISQIKQSHKGRQTAEANAVKGKVWYERADRAHDADNHDKEFELLLKSASFDYMPAILKISKNYETGNYTHQSDLKAQEWAAKLPENQYLQFLFRRGFALTTPQSSADDQAVGLRFLEIASGLAPENNSLKNIKKQIGWIYWQGHESLRDEVKAREFYQELGGDDLENFLMTSGFKLEQAGESKKARALYQDAIDQGSDRAKVNLAYNYLKDWEDETGHDKAVALFRDTLSSEDIVTRHQATQFFMESNTQEDKEMGLRRMTELADGGYGPSQLYLINHYTNNPNVPPNYERAAIYLKPLEYMPAKAKVTWAHMKRTGTATEKDLNAAFKLYTEAVEDNYTPANLALAHMYRLGLGTPKNPQKAKTLYEAARYDNRHPASYYIGLMYENGDLGAADMTKAFDLYKMAAEAEYGPALMRLALGYELGEGASKDTAKAFKLMTEAAYTDHAPAIENLIRYYSEAIGTERSSEYAAIWRKKIPPASPANFIE